MKELTKAEEQVMQILWKIEKGTVKDIIAEMDNPKPAYNTVSTIVRILESKEIVSHEPLGRGHVYFPLLSKNEYKSNSLKRLIKGYFSNSVSDMVSFFSKNQKMELEEMEEILSLMQQEIKKEKSKK